jgi:hypothetical protein
MKLFYRSTELCKSELLSCGASFEDKTQLSAEARVDLQWIINNIADHNGLALITPPPDAIIACDASKLGWGVCCNSTRNTGGLWSLTEAAHHINYLETLAAIFALKCFAYYELCNSRHFNNRTEWSLHPIVFMWLSQAAFVPDVDLFASRLNAKVARFVSWCPDPSAFACDAFSLHWGDFNAYAFPPFSLIPRVLVQVKRDKVQRALLITPVWPSRPYSDLKLKDLTLKVATLTALVTAQRCQSLHKLSLKNMSVYEKNIVFIIRDSIKTSRPGKAFPCVEITRFAEDINLCPRAHLLHYIAQTEPLKTIEEGSVNQLFISYCKPHKAVRSCTFLSVP